MTIEKNKVPYVNKENEVTDTFDLSSRGRTFGTERDYAIPGLTRLIESANVQEKVKNHDMVGYYGHPDDKLFKKIIPDEQTPVMNPKTGKIVMVALEPANITTALSIAGSKITHTERFLNTPSGKVARAMHESNAGGWSWRVGGRDNAFGQANVMLFGGFDYVRNPNYLSQDKLRMIAESLSDDEDFDQESLDKMVERCEQDTGETLNLYELQQELVLAKFTIEKFQENESSFKSLQNLQLETQSKSLLMLQSAIDKSTYVIPEDVIKIMTEGARNEQEIALIVECFNDISNIDTTYFSRHITDKFIAVSPLKKEVVNSYVADQFEAMDFLF